MSSLVADYGSSSESNSSFGEVEDVIHKGRQNVAEQKLPLPTFSEQGTASVANSVFKNPFVEEENAKSALLEKHVKMIPAKEDITQINGRQICWMYRKGRCRFGHNCKYAHDSDLHSDTPTDTSDLIESNIVCDSLTGSAAKVDKSDIPVSLDSEVITKKKRPGLTQGLKPGKKVLNSYKKQKLNSKNL